VDFSLSPETVALRDEVRSVLAAHDSEEAVRLAHESGTNVAPELYRALGERGVIARSVVGIGAGDPIDSWVTLSELEKAALPYDALAMAMSAAAMINIVGTDLQKERVLPGLLAGESLVCFGLTEPDVGSDLPAVATRSQRVEGGWVINGTKMWTTMAHVADWCLLLTRSDPAAPPYRGYTFFLLPMSTPGITIEPIWTMSTERSNTMFLDGVRVGDEWVLGEPEEGWQTLGVMLSFERGMANTGFGIPLLRRAVAWAHETGRMEDRLLRDELAQIAIENEVAKLLTQRTVWLAASGAQGPAAVAGSVAKIFATEAYQRAAELVLSVV
jgi:alkylation response protein AidB-like acyl-CoA dehydrogenase